MVCLVYKNFYFDFLPIKCSKCGKHNIKYPQHTIQWSNVYLRLIPWYLQVTMTVARILSAQQSFTVSLKWNI